MAHRILGLDIGAARVKGTVVETKLRSHEVIQSAIVPIHDIEAEVAAPPETASAPFPHPAEALEPGEAGGIEDAGDIGEFEPPPRWADAVRSLLARPGLVFDEIVCALPGQLVSTRVLTFPFTQRAKIQQVLRFEIEDLVPFDMDDMALSWQVIGSRKNESRVLVSAVRRQDIARFLRQLADVGVDPRALTMTTSALSVTAANAVRGRVAPYAAVDLGASSVDVVIFEGPRLVSVRSIPEGFHDVAERLGQALGLPADKARALVEQVARIFPENERPADARVARLSDEIKRALAPLVGRLRQTLRATEKDHEFRVDTLFVAGGGSRVPGLSEYLAAELGVAVEPLRTFAPEAEGLVTENEETDATYAQSLGLALATATTVPLRGLNFRAGEFAYHKIAQAVQGSLKALGIMAGILAALFIVLVLQARSVQAKRVEAIESAARKLYVDAFKQQPPPTGDVAAAFKAQVSQVQAKARLLGFFGEKNQRALDIIRAMSNAIPKEIFVEIKQMDVKPEWIKIEALTDTFQTVNKIETELQKNAIFYDVTREDAKKTPDDKIKFKLTIHLVPKEAGKSGVATLFKKEDAPLIPGQAGTQ
ncbi:pilus assembly protein PilM [bacterium]|nr:pilus assembly protein PilM [bacterium]